MQGILYGAIQPQDDDMPIEYARDASQKDTCKKFLRLMKSNSTATPANEKRSFAHQKILVNTLIGEDRTIFLAACREDFNRSAVFECLAEMKKVYASMRSNRGALEKNMRALVDRYSDPNSDKVSQIKSVLEQTKIQMVDNIDRVIERGERIDGLCERSELLVAEAATFESQATTLKWSMYKKRIIMCIVIFLVIAIIIFIIVLLACKKDGVNFDKCK